jgi:rhodanese-related sulfurtransferase
VVHELKGQLESFPIVGASAFADAASDGAQIVDTRAPDEWEDGVIEGSTLSYAPDLATDTPIGLDKASLVWVACESGYRATIAASFLEARGYEPVVLANAGVTDVLRKRSKGT